VVTSAKCEPSEPTRPNSGFSLDAAVRVGAQDRAGLERRLRYCARPPFALARLELLDAERVVYRLPKPQRDGTTALTLTPLELINQLAARLVHRLAAARAASPSLSRRARAQRAAACGCHRLHT
jgi:hypothetical protein